MSMEGAHWRIYSNDALSWSFPGGLAVVENPLSVQAVEETQAPSLGRVWWFSR